ncbi:MAG TPA: biopolymer transporter ExbD [Methylocystis sp.]|nr:biopolymer transporter ExbD [Methylocystis sp.]
MGLSAGKRATGGFQPLAEINVTPLVDVMLVLLIIFMVTAPMMAAGMKVELPQARTAKLLNPKEPVVITIAKGGKLMLGADEVARERLVEVVRAKLDGDLAHVIHLRGDRDASIGDMVGLMDELSANGLTHIAILSKRESAAKGSAREAAK